MNFSPDEGLSPEAAEIQAYALVGRAATCFSTLEFHIQFLCSFLVSDKILSPESVILTRRHTFAEKIQLIRDFIALRNPKDDPVRQRVLKLTSDLDALRERRNFFIHGYWLINWQLIFSEGLIRCSDPKWRYDKTTEEWSSMQSHDIHLDELENLIRHIATVTHEVHEVLNTLESSQGTSSSKDGEAKFPDHMSD